MSIILKLSSSPLTKTITAILAIAFVLLQGLKLAFSNDVEQLVYTTLFGQSDAVSRVFYVIVNSISIFLSIWILMEINSANRFIDKDPFPLGVFIFVGLTSMPSVLLFPEIQFSALLIVFVLYLLMLIYNNNNISGILFGSSILVGLSALFFYPFAIYLILIFVGFYIFKPFDIRSFMFVILGPTLLYLYLFSAAFIFNWDLFLEQKIEWFQMIYFNQLFSLKYLGITSLFIIGGLSLARAYNYRQKLIVRQRNQLLVVFTFLVLSVTLALFFDIHKTLFLILLPLGFFFLFLYHNLKRKWILDGILLIILFYNTWQSFLS